MAIPRIKIRHEVEDYLQSAEQLLSIAAAGEPPLSEDELRVVSSYVEELAKMVAQRTKI